MSAEADAALAEVTWNLDDLLEGDAADPAAAVTALLDEAEQASEKFAETYEGKVAELDGPGLIVAMTKLADISDRAGRALNYAHLRFAADTADPANGALLQMGSERATAIQTRLLFFELEWAALDDETAEALLVTPGLEFCEHHLRNERRYRDHLLSAPEERIATEMSVTGAGAWSRLFDELTSAIRVDLPEAEEPVSLDIALSHLHDPDREVRKSTAEAITESLEPGLRTRAYVFNTLLQDKAIKDRLRSYPHWLATRNLSNEASDESVQALVEAVKGRYDLARSWYRTKAKLLEVDRLADYDRMAAIATDDVTIEWNEGREIVQSAFDSLAPQAGEVVGRFFEGRWIDAPPAPNKRGGAFSASTVPSAHPYVMLNYTDRRRDVLTLAHELGHGLHQALAAKQGIFHQDTPLTVAETASVFAEELVFGRLLAAEEDPASRLGLLSESVEGQIATIFRQIAMNQFEDRVHTARREEGELSVERFGELWGETQEDLLGDSVEVTEGYRSWWSYVPHFIGSPGYVYAYAYGQLLALSVYRLYEEQGDAIVPGYLEMLSAGGSKSPEQLGALVGVDLSDPSFWDNGLDLVAGQIEAAQAAADQVLQARDKA
ncbi:MAG: M3 family oligoendopeptidase [Solirubrobacterales bacterium]|nr:M3 family oligoendopeptidase [Solirubrobacterales bacterium]OJU93646.1 MAG: oligoendopeptidase [Solirubrobacterales bacterium 67-14]